MSSNTEPSEAREKETGVTTQLFPTKHDVTAIVAAQAREALAVVFAFRCINAFCVRTFFQPDEYFQALEPAWQMVFGTDSGAWMTWEWTHQLRSSLHPAVFALGYYIVNSFWAASNAPVTKAKWLLMAPKFTQAAFAALSDWYTWRLAEKLYGPSSTAAWSVLLMTLLNPWQWYTATRAFSNCLETTLTAMALYYLPWELLGVDAPKDKAGHSSPAVLDSLAQVNSLRCSLVLAAFAVLLRPTNLFIWLAIGTLAVTRATLSGSSPLNLRVFLLLIREALLCGSFALGVSLLVDRQYYGEWTFPPLTFLHFNVTQDLAAFYGENDWHYYLSQGIPLLCTTFTPFALQGLVRSLDAEKTWPVTTSNALKALTLTIITTVLSLSLVSSHKEVRFITPLLPALHIVAAPHVSRFFTTAAEAAGAAASCPPPPTPRWKRKPLLAAGLVVNVVIGGYLSYLHAAAPVSVMDFLRGQFETLHPDLLAMPAAPAGAHSSEEEHHHPLLPRPPPPPPSEELFAVFLTPCHATPWRSHLVYPALRARALTCDPPVDTAPGSAARAAYRDETRRFYADPAGFLEGLWGGGGGPSADSSNSSSSSSSSSDSKVESEEVEVTAPPRYIVGFEGVEPHLRAYFDPTTGGPGARHGVELAPVWSAWNGLFADDERKSGRLVVWDTGLYPR
ncbi:glycosyltransferase family 22 protein [Xylariaceae sp. FL0804]|nr:glycosyltransferase family 22 protein [Xylariaceae sp. FL0804]